MWPFQKSNLERNIELVLSNQATILRELRNLKSDHDSLKSTVQFYGRQTMSKIEDVQDSLNTISDEVGKIATETQSLLDKITELQNSQGIPADLQAKIDAVATQAQALAAKVKAVDDLVPDAAPPTDGGTGGDVG